ncbi:hypothetical protein TIFTF001_056085, partial [Ficus carica]
MHSTMVLNITKDLLQDWYFYLEFASWRVDFDIDFLEAPLEKITRAFLGFQLRKLEVDVPRIINKKIAEQKHKLEVVKQMHSTMVLDFTKDLLQHWYFYYKFASWRVDFNIDFLKAPLERIARAYFDLQLTKLEEDVPATINKRIGELQSKI